MINTTPFTIITPTGDRPIPFAVRCKYVQRQTVLPTEWIVVDDGEQPQSIHSIPVSLQLKSIRRERQQHDPQHTLPVQLAVALRHVTTGYVLVMEDDDWYRQDYCERMMGVFCDHPDALLVGQAPAFYYHIPARRYAPLNNRDRASLCQTGFRSELIPEVLRICRECAQRNDPFVDLNLWRATSRKFVIPDRPRWCVGIKGLPGRTSDRTIGHNSQYRGYRPDPEGLMLQSLIGADVKLYEKFQDPIGCTLDDRSSILRGGRSLKREAIEKGRA